MNDIDRAIESCQARLSHFIQESTADISQGHREKLARQIEVEKVKIEALEKQTPKKPTEDINGCGLYCPGCKKIWVNSNNDFCHRCGQALDWRDSDE